MSHAQNKGHKSQNVKKQKISKKQNQKRSKTRHPAHEHPIFVSDSKSSCFFTYSCKIWCQTVHWECGSRQNYDFVLKNSKRCQRFIKNSSKYSFWEPGSIKKQFPMSFSFGFHILKYNFDHWEVLFWYHKVFCEVFFLCVEGWFVCACWRGNFEKDWS